MQGELLVTLVAPPLLGMAETGEALGLGMPGPVYTCGGKTDREGWYRQQPSQSPEFPRGAGRAVFKTGPG